jgi:hypothetical protein
MTNVTLNQKILVACPQYKRKEAVIRQLPMDIQSIILFDRYDVQVRLGTHKLNVEKAGSVSLREQVKAPVLS